MGLYMYTVAMAIGGHYDLEVDETIPAARNPRCACGYTYDGTQSSRMISAPTDTPASVPPQHSHLSPHRWIGRDEVDPMGGNMLFMSY